MKIQNFDIKSATLFGGVGHVVELGDYAGYYSPEAYETLKIEGELEDKEWYDLMTTDDGKIYAVAGDAPRHVAGNFYFKQVIAVKVKELMKIALEIAETIYDTDPNMCVTLGVDARGNFHISRLHFKNEVVLRSLPYIIDFVGGYAEDESEEEKLETINYYEHIILSRFDGCKKWSEIQIIYI